MGSSLDGTQLVLLYSWWSDTVMVWGKLPVPGRPTIWIMVGQGPFARAVGVRVEVVWTF